jgi:aryl carrier-like protein
MLFVEKSDSIEARAARTSELDSAVSTELLNSLDSVVTALLAGDDGQLKLRGRPENSANSRPKLRRRGKARDEGPEPSAETLKSVTSIVADFLQQPASSVTAGASLVSLGLTSLRAVALSRALQKKGLSVDPVDIIQGDSTRAVAQKIDAQGQSSNGDSSDASADDGETKLAEELGGLPKLALDDADKPELALCTPLQAGMLSQTLASEGTLYVHAFPLRLRRAADAEQLRSAWDQALGAFDILRTSFHFAESSGRWAQVVHSAFALPWKTIQTEDAPADLAKQAVSSLSLGSEGGLSKPPWCLLEAHGQDATHLVVAMHHAMYDGVSFANLLGHVARIFAGDEAPKLPAFIPLARRIVREEKRATEHWTERMRGSSTRFLPERDASRSDSTAAWRASIDFSADEGEQLRRVARRYQVTPQSIGQLALAQLLARYSGLVDISFCQVVSGRTLPDAGEVVGPVFNTIPCRVQLDSHLKAREALRRIHADNVAGLKAQHASLRDIQKALQLPAISDVLFVFQPFVERDGSETERPWSAVPRSSDTDEGATQFSLNLELHEQRDGFAVFSSCAADVFSREQLDEALQLYRQAVVDIISQPNGTVVTPEAEAKAAKLKPAETNEQSSESGDEPAAELSGQQQEVRKLAAQILRVDVDKLLPSTKLASVGLDSISAIQLSSRCRKAGIKLAPTDIVRAPTIKELLRLVSGSPNGHAESKKPTSTGIVTLSGSQAEVATSHISEVLRRGSKVLVSSAGVEYAFACWQRSNGRAFQVCVLRRANERIDVKQLEQAWSSLLEKHEVLRGIPVPTNDASQPLALLIAKDGPTLQVQELEGADEDEAATQQARSLLCEHMPANAAQCRLLLLHGKKHDYVVLNMAHVLYGQSSVACAAHQLTLSSLPQTGGRCRCSSAIWRPCTRARKPAHPQTLRASSARPAQTRARRRSTGARHWGRSSARHSGRHRLPSPKVRP